MVEKFIETERGKVYYWVGNNFNTDKNTLFFFHGLTADHTMFEKQIDYFQNDFNVIAWDAPMHGKSRPYKDFSFENASSDIKEILKENNIKEFVGIGQSLGGYFVQSFMLRNPNVVTAFIGIGTSPYGEKYYSNSDKFILKQVGWMACLYPFKILKKAAAKQATTTKEGYENMLSMVSQYTKREYASIMQRAYDAFLVDNRDLKFTCPVLITDGEFDKAGKVKIYSEMWSKEMGEPLNIIRGAGHNANVDKPEETNKLIENFLNEKVYIKA